MGVVCGETSTASAMHGSEKKYLQSNDVTLWDHEHTYDVNLWDNEHLYDVILGTMNLLVVPGSNSADENWPRLQQDNSSTISQI